VKHSDDARAGCNMEVTPKEESVYMLS